jgi:hypothetical protein
MSILTPEQIQNLVIGHCDRVISQMSPLGLKSYAMKMMAGSFDKDPGQGNTDLAMLVTDIYEVEEEDSDSVHEFMVGAGLTNEQAEDLLNRYNLY